MKTFFELSAFVLVMAAAAFAECIPAAAGLTALAAAMLLASRAKKNARDGGRRTRANNKISIYIIPHTAPQVKALAQKKG